MRNLNDSIGDAANDTASALSTEKFRSGMGHLANPRRSLFHSAKNPLMASQTSVPPASPFHLVRIKPDQPVTLIDRHDEIIRRSLHTIHEQGLSVRLHLLQYRIAFDDLSPRFEIK